MPMQLKDKKQRILAELGEEEDRENLVRTMEYLDKYNVSPPAARSTEELIALLKPVSREFLSAQDMVKGVCRQSAILHLVRPQAMLLSKWFVMASSLVLLAGLVITNKADGDTVKFLANASPILGIFTVFYEFRAKLSGVHELETACPYSPAQLAAARLIVVIGFDILLCLVATPAVSYWQGGVLWKVVVSWLAPLLLMLGIALAASLRIGIAGGCLVSASIWALQLAIGEGKSVFTHLLSRQPAVFADLTSLVVGTMLIFYAYKRWHAHAMLLGGDQSD